ncbi:hypothetical protein XANCAGTX0491_001339 [Xanthoria calcicola]
MPQTDSVPQTSTHDEEPLFLIFSGESDGIQETTRIYRTQKQAIQWCEQQVQAPRINSFSSKDSDDHDEVLRIDSNTQTLVIEGKSKGPEDVEMVYTVERCGYDVVSKALQAYLASGKTSKKELWAVYDAEALDVWDVCLDEEDAECLSGVSQSVPDITIERVLFVDEADR